MKKCSLLTWKLISKKTNITVKKIVELQEDQCLFARMMVMCKSRPELDLQEAIGTYEFCLVPRLLFSTDGTLLHCSTKSALMSLTTKGWTVSSGDLPPEASVVRKVVIVDGMAELQSLDKPAIPTTCAHLAEHLTENVGQQLSCEHGVLFSALLLLLL